MLYCYFVDKFHYCCVEYFIWQSNYYEEFTLLIMNLMTYLFSSELLWLFKKSWVHYWLNKDHFFFVQSFNEASPHLALLVIICKLFFSLFCDFDLRLFDDPHGRFHILNSSTKLKFSSQFTIAWFRFGFQQLICRCIQLMYYMCTSRHIPSIFPTIITTKLSWDKESNHCQHSLTK